MYANWKFRLKQGKFRIKSYVHLYVLNEINLNKRWIFKNLCGNVRVAIGQKKEVKTCTNCTIKPANLFATE